MNNHDFTPPAAAAEEAEQNQTQPPADETAAEVDLAGLEAELAQHRAQMKELEDQLLRRAAEFQNYRRRTEAEFAGAAERGRAEALLPMLDVFDDLRRSLDAAEKAATGQNEPLYQALRDGVELVYKKFEDTLKGFGVEAIEAVGQPFDEELHEAMMQQEAPDAPAGTVVGEIQKGYRMGERVLRHARVIVAH